MPAQPFRCDLHFGKEDIDALGHVNNVVSLRWVQEAAQAHWNTLAGPALRSLYPWIVLRHEIDYRAAAQQTDIPFALTWVGETDALRSIRHVEIRAASGRLLAEARTTWCLIDPISQKPRRIPAEIRKTLEPMSTDDPTQDNAQEQI
ncbi:MAG: acyl-CoA thioesterase [Bacteroidota bacterium]